MAGSLVQPGQGVEYVRGIGVRDERQAAVLASCLLEAVNRALDAAIGGVGLAVAGPRATPAEP